MQSQTELRLSQLLESIRELIEPCSEHLQSTLQSRSFIDGLTQASPTGSLGPGCTKQRSIAAAWSHSHILWRTVDEDSGIVPSTSIESIRLGLGAHPAARSIHAIHLSIQDKTKRLHPQLVSHFDSKKSLTKELVLHPLPSPFIRSNLESTRVVSAHSWRSARSSTTELHSWRPVVAVATRPIRWNVLATVAPSFHLPLGNN